MKTILLTLGMLLSIQLHAAIGDTFQARTPEGVSITFQVTGENKVQVGTGEMSSSSSAISSSTSGSLTISETVSYKGISYSVTSIGDYAFFQCGGLTSVSIPNSVTSIGNFAFRGCSGLTSMIIPNSVTSIGRGTFRACSGLTSVNIGNSVTSIGINAFENCSGLTSVSIPNSVTSIGNSVFYGCSGLTSIEVEIDNPKYDSREKCNAIVEKETNTLILGCVNTVIPNSVTSIGNGAFRNCSSLTSITIPNSVTSIGEYNQEIEGETNVEIIPVIA